MSRDRSTEAEEERLRRLGAQWFAEVRRRNPEPEPPRRRDADGGDAGLFEGLLGDDEDDSGDSGSDGGD